MALTPPKMHPRAKLPINDPPKVWVSSFPSVDRNGKLVLAIMKNQKMALNPQKCIPEQNSVGHVCMSQHV